MTIKANSGRIQLKPPVRLAALVLMFATGALLMMVGPSSSTSAQAQNLVPNPSFELYTACPIGPVGIDLFRAASWTLPTGGSSDYYHSCATPASGVSTPTNDFGSQTPRTGAAYAGFILRPSTPNYREYIEAPLTAPLVAGMAYQVSFYVSLSDGSRWAIDRLGAYLSVGSVGPVNLPLPLPFVPQIVNPTSNYITNKTGWTLISGTYLALGGEDHLVIGNFADDSSTTPVTGLGGFYNGSYYYVDDVSVVTLVPPCVTPPSGMVAWWPLDETAGATAVNDIAPLPASTVNDFGTPLPDGKVGYTNTSPVNHGPDPVAGVVNGALWFFNGTHVEVTTPSTDLTLGRGDFSIDAWVKVTAHQPDFAIVDKFDPSNNTGFVFGLNFSGLYLDISGTQFYSDPFFLGPGSWAHVAVTVDRNDPAGVIFYINGAQAGTFAPPHPLVTVDNNRSLLIANSRVYPTMGDFQIDELEIFKGVVSPGNIAAIYNAGSAGKCKPVGGAVGGIVELVAGGSDSPASAAGASGPSFPYAAVAAGGAAAAVVTLALSGWYVRRRWLR